MAATMTQFQNAKRVHPALTAGVEKRLLCWVAERMPAWVNSDHLTMLGFVSQIGAGIAYALSRFSSYGLLAACVLIVLNWFGDSLDGTLARVRNKQRPRYGFYVDHIIDAFGATAMMTGMALSGFVHWQIAWAMLLGLLLAMIESFLTTYCLGDFHLSHGWFGPTELRIVLIIGNLRLLHSPYAHLGGKEFLLFDVGGVIAAAGMLIIALVAAAHHTAALYRMETVCR
jgi:archaetidylinositol phosphate synthase